MNWKNRLLFVINLALGAVLIYYISIHTGVDHAGADKQGWSPTDIVTMLLTSVTIVVGALGIGLAAMAFFGYQSVQDRAVDRAEAAAMLKLEARLEKELANENFKERLAEMVQTRIAGAADGVWADFAADAYPVDDVTTQEAEDRTGTPDAPSEGP